MTDIVLELMNLIIDGFAINHHKLTEGRESELFDFIFIEAILFL